jgi:hypothetical protein
VRLSSLAGDYEHQGERAPVAWQWAQQATAVRARSLGDGGVGGTAARRVGEDQRPQRCEHIRGTTGEEHQRSSWEGSH